MNDEIKITTPNDLVTIENAVKLKKASAAAHERFKRTLSLSVSLLPDGGPATITAMRGVVGLGSWTVERGEVLETIAALIEGEAL